MRNESAARQPAPCRGPRRTAKHHRLFEVEKPHGGIQPWHAARRTAVRRGRPERISRTGPSVAPPFPRLQPETRKLEDRSPKPEARSPKPTTPADPPWLSAS